MLFIFEKVVPWRSFCRKLQHALFCFSFSHTCKRSVVPVKVLMLIKNTSFYVSAGVCASELSWAGCSTGCSEAGRFMGERRVLEKKKLWLCAEAHVIHDMNYHLLEMLAMDINTILKAKGRGLWNPASNRRAFKFDSKMYNGDQPSFSLHVSSF